MAGPDLLIKQAKLRDRTDLVNISISGGKITSISGESGTPAAVEIDAGGNLVTEAFANAHLHLCKVYTLQMMDEEALTTYLGLDSNMGKTMKGIELAARVKEKYDEKWIIKNVRRALVEAAKYGCINIRALADVDNKARLEGVKALLRAREEFKEILNIQVVAFAQDGLAREPGADLLMRQAMELGADVVGGIPWIEYTDEDIRAHVKFCYDLAEEFDKPVSMLVDDAGDAGLRSLELMATRNHQARVAWSIARAPCPCHGPLPDSLFPKIGRFTQKSRNGGCQRSSYRSIARTCPGIIGGKCTGLPGAGRYLRCLLSIWQE